MVKEDDKYVIDGPIPAQPLLSITLGELVYNNLTIHCRKPYAALVDAVTGEEISYRQLLSLSCSLAKCLQQNNYGPNTMISISSENNLQFFIPIIASLYIGATMAPINHSYTDQELKHSLNICKPTIVFCSTAVAPKFVKRKKEFGQIREIIVIDSNESIPETIPMLVYIQKHLKSNKLLEEFKLAPFDPKENVAFVMCSSGTTGLPKGVMLTHSNVMVRYNHSLNPTVISPGNDRFLGVLPFFHGYGLITNFIAIVFGQRIVVLKRFEERAFLRAIEQYKIERLWLAPPLLVFLAKSPIVAEYDLSFIKEITSGAAPLSRDTEETLKKRLGIREIRQGYGLTEATLAILTMPLNTPPRHGTSGTVCDFMRIKVRDPESGRSLGPNQVGEICVKGPMVMKGYYGNEEATRSSFTGDGWLLTGDLGYYDEDRFFFIVDRLKELIKYKGFQVAPAELEAILLTNPNIRDAGVVGLPHEDAGELPVAFVVKTPNSTMSEKDVQNFVAKQVSSQKRLRGGVFFIDSIPKNPSGKILRRVLRQMLIAKYKSKL